MSAAAPGWVMVGCTDATRETLHRLARLGALPSQLVTISQATAEANNVSNYAQRLDLDCEQFGVPYVELHKYNMSAPEDEQLFAVLQPAAMLVVGWQRLVPPNILNHVGIAAAFHAAPGILPYGRGRAPVNWTIIEGRRQMALHLFELAAEADAGDVIGIRLIDVNEYDNARSVYYKIAIAQAELIAEYLPLLLSRDCPRLRQRGAVRELPKRTPEEGRIDWTRGADEVARFTRALTDPFPGAYTLNGEQRINIWEAQPFSRDMFSDAQPGEVSFVPHNGYSSEFVVKCGDGSVLVRRCHPTGVVVEGDVLR